MTMTNRLRRFFGGRGYVILTALLIFLGHSTFWVEDRLLFDGYQEFLFGGLLILTIDIACFVCDDLRFLLMPAISSAFIVPKVHAMGFPYYSEFYLDHGTIALTYVLALALIGGLVCFAARNRANRGSGALHSPVFWSMVLFCGLLMLNGIGSRYYSVADTKYPLTMAFAMLGFYLLFTAYVRFDGTVCDHFMFCVLVLGGLLLAQLGFTCVDPGPDGIRFTASGGIDKISLNFGWGNSNAMGGMLAYLMPAGFYFAYSHRWGWLGYCFGGAMFLGVVLSQSRGALLAAAVTLLLSVLVLVCGGKNRRVNRILTVLALLGALGVAVLFRGKLMRLVRTMLEYGTGDTGRFEIWEFAIEKFREYPVFGAGFYTDFHYELWEKNVYPYFYHNTPLQVLASGGLVAFVAYFCHRVTTVVLTLRKPNAYKTFMGLCILGLLVFCLFEVIFFATYPVIVYSVMLLFMEKKTALGKSAAVA